ncbi:arginine--tRNA ligase [Firmicutes bacterium CAG:884]|nr:arginine--tRNA ligase [Bacillota bacterium]CCY93203.1 arginine--tRNA ligase [Firmicutes bacterium CAG:884]
MSLIKENEKYLKELINNLGYEIDNVSLEPSSRKEFGQYQINSSMLLASKYHMNPREIASKIVQNLDSRFTNVNIQGPGFINLSLTDEYLMNYFNNKSFNDMVDKENPKTIVIDFGGANAAKSLHVGHMRSANIGEALRRLLLLFGNNVISDVHLGDLGRQAGMLISQLELEQPNLPYFDKNYKGEYPKLEITAKDLGRMYPLASKLAKEDPVRMEEVRRITAEIDKGNKVYTDLWKQMVEVSKVEIKKVYNELNCHFDLFEGELDSFKDIPATTEIMKPYLYESEGALVIDVAKEDDKKEMPPLLYIKTDGATIYATRDLATIYSRVKRFDPNEIIYVVDDRQGLYFEQVFRAAYKTGLVKNAKLEHVGFGTINGIDGKPYKTRDGGVMELSTLISLVKDEISKKIKDEIKDEEKEEIINKLTIATIKYTDLLPYRKTDYIFDPVKFSSIDGKTGPYILYTIVRIKSILNKVDIDSKMTNICNDEMRNVLVKMTEISNALTNAYNERTLNYIAEMLYDICSLFNKFYNNCNIVNEQNMDNKASYVAFIKIVYNYIKNLLNILAIDEVEKM